MIKKLIYLVLALHFFQFTAFSQTEKYPYPPLSAHGKVIQEIGFTKVSIEYERPSVRNRKIFGDLVPWDKVWRTGAGKCTKITFDRPVTVGGQHIQSGTYSLFTIPNPDEWIVILNQDTSLYGSGFYDSEKDVARFIALPQKSNRFYETLNFDIDLIPNDAIIYLSWANTQISFALETNTDQEVLAFIQSELMTDKQKKSDIYAGAAEYHYLQGSNLMQAIIICNKALVFDPENRWAQNLKIKIYTRLKMYPEALEQIKLAILQAEHYKFANEAVRQEVLDHYKEKVTQIKALMY